MVKKYYLSLCSLLLVIPVVSQSMEYAYKVLESQALPKLVNDLNLDQETQLSPINVNNPKLLRLTDEAIQSHIQKDLHNEVKIVIENDFSLVYEPVHQTGMAIFEIPETHEFHHLTQQEMRATHTVFQEVEFEITEGHIIALFKYNNEELLPETKSQAIFFTLQSASRRWSKAS